MTDREKLNEIKMLVDNLDILDTIISVLVEISKEINYIRDLIQEGEDD